MSFKMDSPTFINLQHYLGLTHIQIQKICACFSRSDILIRDVTLNTLARMLHCPEFKTTSRRKFLLQILKSQFQTTHPNTSHHYHLRMVKKKQPTAKSQVLDTNPTHIQLLSLENFLTSKCKQLCLITTYISTLLSRSILVYTIHSAIMISFQIFISLF